MSDPIEFLLSMGQVMAAMALYDRGHPARERALDGSFEHLIALVEDDENHQFSFIDGEVVFQRQVLRDLRNWEWASRFASVGIERVEFDDTVSREDYEDFLRDAFLRFKGESLDTSEARHMRKTGIRYGPIAVGESDRDDMQEATQNFVTTATIAYSLQDDIETVEWMHGEVKDQGNLPLVEAETVVRSLSIAMHSQEAILIPLLELKEFDQYTTTHSTNVAVLAMALAEYIGLGGQDVQVMGVAGLLHDLGKVRIPLDILNKPGRFTDEERAVMQDHPTEGAKIILGRESRLEVPAVVAYEHHIMLNGGGYPSVHYRRSTHVASRLVHVCDVYDALCTNRPYREAWDSEKALSLIEEQTGGDFDPQFANPFAQMIREQTLQRVSLNNPVITAA